MPSLHTVPSFSTSKIVMEGYYPPHKDGETEAQRRQLKVIYKSGEFGKYPRFLNLLGFLASLSICSILLLFKSRYNLTTLRGFHFFILLPIMILFCGKTDLPTEVGLLPCNKMQGRPTAAYLPWLIRPRDKRTTWPASRGASV